MNFNLLPYKTLPIIFYIFFFPSGDTKYQYEEDIKWYNQFVPDMDTAFKKTKITHKIFDYKANKDSNNRVKLLSDLKTIIDDGTERQSVFIFNSHGGSINKKINGVKVPVYHIKVNPKARKKKNKIVGLDQILPLLNTMTNLGHTYTLFNACETNKIRDDLERFLPRISRNDSTAHAKNLDTLFKMYRGLLINSEIQKGNQLLVEKEQIDEFIKSKSDFFYRDSLVKINSIISSNKYKEEYLLHAQSPYRYIESFKESNAPSPQNGGHCFYMYTLGKLSNTYDNQSDILEAFDSFRKLIITGQLISSRQGFLNYLFGKNGKYSEHLRKKYSDRWASYSPCLHSICP